MNKPTEIHIILREVEDDRFPGIKGCSIQLSPEPTSCNLDELSLIEVTALQMVQLFALYQKHQGARQFVDGQEVLMDLTGGEGEFEWPDKLEVEV